MCDCPTVMVKIPSPTVPVTVELHEIIKELGEYGNWKSTFNKHCKRAEKPEIPAHEIVMDHDLGERTYTYYTTWQGRKYQSYTYGDSHAAYTDLYQKLVSSVIEQELAKVK